MGWRRALSTWALDAMAVGGGSTRAMGGSLPGRRPWGSFCAASKTGEVELAPMGEEGQGREQAWALD
jgi:hypothetical protein